jgi:3-oxoacyl-[acyl-carrier protein] reductase
MQLKGKVAIVTGGGRGIGRSTALALAREGADVVVTARTDHQIRAVAGEIVALGQQALHVPCDVGDYEQCLAVANRTLRELGRIDILVANAGGGDDRRPVVETDPHKWTEIVASNLHGVYYFARSVVEPMQKVGGGKIIVVGSGMGHVPLPGNSAYAVAKAGAWMLTRCLAQEVWELGIDVNEVVPGPVLTDNTKEIFSMGAPVPYAASERVKGPEEVADLILHLATWKRGGPTGQSFSLARRPI